MAIKRKPLKPVKGWVVARWDWRAKLQEVDLPGLPTRGPYRAETGSARGDDTWPLWCVMGAACNAFGCFFSRDEAEWLAVEANKFRGYVQNGERPQ